MNKRILLISPVPTHPQSAGNRARVFQLAQSIRELGCDLYLAHVELEKGDPAAMRQWWGCDRFFQISHTMPRKFGFRLRRKFSRAFLGRPVSTYAVDDWYDDAVSSRLTQLHQRMLFDAVVVEYVFFSKALTAFPNNTLKIIDTHDKFTDRHRLYAQNNTAYNWYSTTAVQEKIGLRRADVIIAIQEKERDFFVQLTGRKTVTVGHSVRTIQPASFPPAGATMLFIGSANQSNIDAIRYFIAEILPEVKKAITGVTLLVAGPICRVLDNLDQSIVKCGEPDWLDDLYGKAALVINPIRFGTGLKIKNIEALGYAKPLVTTPVGAEGLENGSNRAFLVAADAAGFAESLVRIFREPSLYRSLCEEAAAYARQWNQKQMHALSSVLTSSAASLASPGSAGLNAIR